MTKQIYTNNTNIPLSLAVWLADDAYDYINKPNYISVTTLIKSPRQIVLSSRSPKRDDLIDIANLMATTIGESIHTSIESSWVNKYKQSMLRLGYTPEVVARIRINPTPEDLLADNTIIPVYMEQRVLRQWDKWTIGGKYDFVGNGTLEDFKSTNVFSYTSGTNEWKYKLQGSLYRWLNPDIITSDHMYIQFIFKDWKKYEARYKAEKGYPATPLLQHKIKLMSLPETELWVNQKMELLNNLWEVHESTLPLCETQDLWQDASTYKYYKNPEKTTRSTANFDTMAEATIKWIEDGRCGVIKEVPGQAKGCLYCDAFNLCTQKDTLIANGTLKLQ